MIPEISAIMHRTRHLVFAAICLGLCVPGCAPTGSHTPDGLPVDLKLDAATLDGRELAPHLSVLVDEAADMDFAAVLARRTDFQAVGQRPAHFGFGVDAAYWMRLRVHNAQTHAVDWLLELDYVFLDSIELYRPTRDAQRAEQYTRTATGDQRPFQQREVAYRTFAFRMHTAPGTFDYYLRLYNPPQARFPMRAYSPADFAARRTVDWLGNGMIFGGLGILFFTNLLLLAAVRDRAYAYLLFFICATSMLYLLLSGFGFQYFWPEFPALNQSLVVVTALVTSGFVAYLRRVLETAVMVPRMDQLLLVLSGICVLFGLASAIVPYANLAPLAARAAIPLLGLLILVIFAVGFMSIGARRPVGKYYFMGAVLFALTVGVAVLGLLDLIRESPALGLFARTGSLALVALMTVGVHYKMKLVRDNLQELNARRSQSAATKTIPGAPGLPENEAAEPDDAPAGNWSIGPRMEQKLQQALFYLKENFRSDISREGLAALLDVNADNLGRFFLMYTGDKLGDYINKLRIEAAARRLHETDHVLISAVAQEVGFENVSTFNRTFKKIMGCTPSEYRSRFANL